MRAFWQQRFWLHRMRGLLEKLKDYSGEGKRASGSCKEMKMEASRGSSGILWRSMKKLRKTRRTDGDGLQEGRRGY